MKKTLLLIIAMLLSLGASAQISNVKTHDAIRTIARFRSGLCSLNADGDIYYLALNSTNRFDDPVLVYLGEGRDSAIQTLVDLQMLHKSMGKKSFAEFTIKVKGIEKVYKVMKADKNFFSFYDIGAAGSVYLSMKEVKPLMLSLVGENGQ